MTSKPYQQIVQFCEQCLDQHGDTAAGVGWSDADAAVRYSVMLDVVRPDARPCSLLDFGCGASHLLEFIRSRGVTGLEYHGLDASEAFVRLSRKKFPEVSYYNIDALDCPASDWPNFDYVTMNGIFTYKGTMPQQSMFEYMQALLLAVFPHAKQGLAFNVHSKQVDWERSDLFHLPLDPLLAFLSRNVSRHIQVRQDYGLYEYTVYVYRRAWGSLQGSARQLIESQSSS